MMNRRLLQIFAAIFAFLVAVIVIWPDARKAVAQIFVPAGCQNVTSTANGITFTSCITPTPTTSPTSAPTATPTPGGITPAQADSLVDMVGVNTHLPYTGTAYEYCWNTACGPSGSSVLSAINDLGIRHLRDGVAASNTTVLGRLASACSAYGIHTGIITSMPNENNQGGGGTTAANMGTIATALGTGCLDYFENDNEQDNSGDPNWVADLFTQQQRMWNARGTNFPNTVKIVGPSVTSAAAYTAMYNGAPTMLNFMDQSNGHYYWSARWPENPGYGGFVNTDPNGTNLGCPALPSSNCGVYGTFQTNLNESVSAFPGKPTRVTESGYPDNTETIQYPQNSLDPYWVDNTTKAKYVPRLFLQGYALGVRSMYLYELVDEGGPPYGQMGLLDYGAYKKASFTALNNLLNIHRDPGGAFTPSTLNATISAPADVKNLPFQKRDGTNILDFWRAVSSWDPNASTPISNTTENVTITLAATPSSVTVYTLNPANGQMVVTNPTPSRTLTVAVTDGFVSVVLGIPTTPIVLATANPPPTPTPMPTSTATANPLVATCALASGTGTSCTFTLSSPPPIGSTTSGAYMVDGNSAAGNLAGQTMPSGFGLLGGPLNQLATGGQISALAFCHNVTTTESGTYTMNFGGSTDAYNGIMYVTPNSHCPTDPSDYNAVTGASTTLNGPNLFPVDTVGSAFDFVGQIGSGNTVTDNGGPITWTAGTRVGLGYGSMTSFTATAGANVEHNRTASSAMASAIFTYVIPTTPQAQTLAQTSSVVTPAPGLTMAPTVAATPAAGQLAIACATINNGNTLTTPTGWNLMLSNSNPGQQSLYVFWKYTTNSEPTSVTFTGSTNTYMSTAIRYYSGVNQTTPFAGVSLTVGSAASVSPSTITAQPYAPGTLPVSCFTVNSKAGVTAHTAGATEDYTAYASSQSGNGFVSGFNGIEGQTGPIASPAASAVPFTASATWNVTNGTGPIGIQSLMFLAPVGAPAPIFEGFITDTTSTGFDANCGIINFGYFGCVPVTTTGAAFSGPSPAPGVYFRAFGTVNNPAVTATRVDFSASPFPYSPTPAPTPTPAPVGAVSIVKTFQGPWSGNGSNGQYGCADPTWTGANGTGGNGTNFAPLNNWMYMFEDHCENSGVYSAYHATAPNVLTIQYTDPHRVCVNTSVCSQLPNLTLFTDPSDFIQGPAGTKWQDDYNDQSKTVYTDPNSPHVQSVSATRFSQLSTTSGGMNRIWTDDTLQTSDEFPNYGVSFSPGTNNTNLFMRNGVTHYTDAAYLVGLAAFTNAMPLPVMGEGLLNGDGSRNGGTGDNHDPAPSISAYIASTNMVAAMGEYFGTGCCDNLSVDGKVVDGIGGNNWSSQINTAIQLMTNSTHKLEFVTYTYQTGYPVTDPNGNWDVQGYAYTMQMLAYDPVYSVTGFQSGNQSGSYISNQPIELLVPGTPRVTLNWPTRISALSSTGAYGGVYVREYTNCHFGGTDTAHNVGNCAFIMQPNVNSDGSKITSAMPTLTGTYNYSLNNTNGSNGIFTGRYGTTNLGDGNGSGGPAYDGITWTTKPTTITSPGWVILIQTLPAAS